MKCSAFLTGSLHSYQCQHKIRLSVAGLVSLSARESLHAADPKKALPTVCRLIVNPQHALPEEQRCPEVNLQTTSDANGSEVVASETLRFIETLRVNFFGGTVPLPNVGSTHVLGSTSARDTATSIKMGLRGAGRDDSLPSNHSFAQLPAHIQVMTHRPET